MARVSLLVAFMLMLPSMAAASDVKFGKWQKDAAKERYFCEYQYPADGNAKQINVQIAIWYPNDPARKGFYYFANKDNKIWGRCVCPASSTYNKTVMAWSKLEGEKWKDLRKGECPAPKNGDAKRASIDKIPDPPAYKK